MKLLALTSLLGGASFILYAALSPESLIQKQASVLKDAKSLTVVYNVRVGGVKTDYSLLFSKPNMLSVDSADRLVETDGKTFWEYDKKKKTYTETPITPELLAKKVRADETLAWAAFFSENLLKEMSNFQGGTPRNVKGHAVTEVTFMLGKTTPRAVTLYIDDKLGVARGLSVKTPNGDLIAMAETIEVGTEPIGAAKFAFAAPNGAEKVEPSKEEKSDAGFALVQPIFAANCSGCHEGARAKGGYSVSSYEGVMSGGYIVPGDPENSRLVKLLTGAAQPRMPMGRGPLSQGDIDKIKAWIQDGAKQ